MTRLQQLYAEQGQSPWLDNLTRGYLRDGTLHRMIGRGIRGVTANPTIIAKAIHGSEEYDEQLRTLASAGYSAEDAYWELAITDIADALEVMRPVFDESGGTDGFVSIEVSPDLARNTSATVAAARTLRERIDRPNLMVKIPATVEGIPAIETMVAEGRNINVTLIFSLARYGQVIEAYLSGLESLVASGGDPSTVSGVASFFVGRVDVEVDKRLDALAVDRSDNLSGWAAVSQARLAYRMFTEAFAGPRWERLSGLGAQPQRPLWASTSTKNPAFPDTLYVDELIGPRTVTTLQEATIARFEDHGRVARAIDRGVDEAVEVVDRLAEVGIDLYEVALLLENTGVAAFQRSIQDVVAELESKAGRWAAAAGLAGSAATV
jgi:transaldolase